MKITIIPVGMIGTNCYLLASGEGECAVIDPGAQPDKIVGIIQKAGLKPRYILLTHGHHDHIGGVKALREAFPEALLHIGRGDVELLEDPGKNYAAMRGLDQEQYRIADAAGLGDGDELELGGLRIRVVETPGHTAGGVCYLCGDALFSGDTLFRDDVGRCDLYGGDYSAMKTSLAKLAALEGEYTVYPGHGDITSLDYERQNNRYINE